jgi:hypothetical protein
LKIILNIEPQIEVFWKYKQLKNKNIQRYVIFHKKYKYSHTYKLNDFWKWFEQMLNHFWVDLKIFSSKNLQKVDLEMFMRKKNSIISCVRESNSSSQLESSIYYRWSNSLSIFLLFLSFLNFRVRILKLFFFLFTFPF